MKKIRVRVNAVQASLLLAKLRELGVGGMDLTKELDPLLNLWCLVFVCDATSVDAIVETIQRDVGVPEFLVDVKDLDFRDYVGDML